MAPVAVDRLREGRDVVAVLRGRRQRAGSHVVVHALSGGREGPARIAVVASRRVGSAIARNRAKRLLREAARHVHWLFGTDVVLVARGACALSTMPVVRDEVEQLATALGVLETVE